MTTIAAISTAPAMGAIGIVRLSGPGALEVLGRVFFPQRLGPWRPRQMRLGQVRAPGGGLIDEALAVWFPGPHSFTGEDCAEIQGHGGLAVCGRVLAAALEGGAVMAAPGEFTRRAFMNGRLDLAQAEAVADLIEAQTEAEAQVAARQLAGGLSQKVGAIHRALLSALADLTAQIDFGEDVEPIDMGELAGQLRSAVCGPLDALLAEAESGRFLRNGLSVVLAGAPNVGKSSLFNALAGRDRALVSDVPGTTRDFVTTAAVWSGVRVELGDTAGLSGEPLDRLDALGQARAREHLAAADVILWVRDCARPDSAEPPWLADAAGRALAVWNKTDLAAPPAAAIGVSARTGQGLEALKGAILKLAVGSDHPAPPEEVPNLRHQAALRETRRCLGGFFGAVEAGQPPDICALELKTALDALGLICGRTISDDVLNEVFGRFCLGK